MADTKARRLREGVTLFEGRNAHSSLKKDLEADDTFDGMKAGCYLRELCEEMGQPASDEYGSDPKYAPEQG